MALITLENPIAWAHFRLRGGWKNVISTTSAFTVIIVGLIVLSLQSDSTASSTILYYWTQGLIGLQLAIVIMFATSAIRNSIRKDLTTKMIESHRLMPVPATQAIPGLIVGSTVQLICLSAMIFLIGTFTCLGASHPLNHWFLANMIVGIFGLSLWFAASLFAFLPAASFGVLGIAVVVSLVSGGLILILPGVGVLAGPIIGRSVFGIIERGGEWNWAYQVSAAAQLCAAALCYLGAIRKYQRDDQLAFTPLLGLILLAGWALLSWIGIRYREEFDTDIFRQMYNDRSLPVLGSIASAYLIALVPVSSTVWLEREWQRRRMLNDVSLQSRPVSIRFIILLAVLIILLVPLGLAGNGLVLMVESHLVVIALSAAFFLLACSYLLRILYRVTVRALLPMIILILLSWCLPLLIDWGRYVAVGKLDEDVLTWIGACSPLGMLYVICQDPTISLWPGLIVQAGWPILIGILFSTARSKRDTNITRVV